MPASFTLMALGCSRACWGQECQQTPKLSQGAWQSCSDHCCTASCAPKIGDLRRSLSWLQLKEKSLLWSKCSFFHTVFCRVPLAQWILNSEVATATLLGCWKNPSGTRLHDCSKAQCLLVHNFFMGSLMKSTLPPLWLFQKLSTFLKEMCHLKASRGMNFNKYIGLPTWDIPSDGTTWHLE